MARECVTHHYACDCRERMFEDVAKELKHLVFTYSKNNQLSVIMSDDFASARKAIEAYDKASGK